MGWFYFITIYLLFVAIITNTIKNQEKKNKVTVILGFGMLAFFAMFHSDTVGNDTPTYIIAFETARDSGISNSYWGFEIGFILLLRTLSYISSSPQILFITVGAFSYYSFGRFVLKYSKIPWLSIYLFFTLGFFDFSLSGIRQLISIAILLLAFDFIIEEQPKKFIVTVIIAALFHNGAWAFLFAYLISRFESKKQYLIILSIATLIVQIIFNKVFELLLIIFPKYNYYIGDTYTDGITRIATILKTAVLLVMIIMSIFSSNGNEIAEQKIDKIMFCYCVTAIAIMILSTNAVAIERSALIYNLFSIVYYPNIIKKFRNRNDKVIVISLSIVLFFAYIWVIQVYRTPEWQTTYPYKFFWQN